MLKKPSAEYLALFQIIRKFYSVVSQPELTAGDYDRFRQMFCNEETWKTLSGVINKTYTYDREYEVMKYEIICYRKNLGKDPVETIHLSVHSNGQVVYTTESGEYLDCIEVIKEEDRRSPEKDIRVAELKDFVDRRGNASAVNEIEAYLLIKDVVNSDCMMVEVDLLDLIHVIQSTNQSK